MTHETRGRRRRASLPLAAAVLATGIAAGSLAIVIARGHRQKPAVAPSYDVADDDVTPAPGRSAATRARAVDEPRAPRLEEGERRRLDLERRTRAMVDGMRLQL